MDSAELMASAEQVRHGIWLNNQGSRGVRDIVELGVAAEEGGWDGVFVSDGIHDGYSDPWTTLAAIAARTERVRLGTWIVPIPQYQPWRLAHLLAGLDHLSGGRVLLGGGLGVQQEYRGFQGDYDPRALGRRYDEALEVITGLWQGEPYSFKGEFFTITEATLPVTPVQQPRIPIVLAAWWPNKRPLKRAARWDGVMPYWPALLGGQVGPEGQQPTDTSVDEELREVLGYYRDTAKGSGEIVLPREQRDNVEYDALCAELGATWLLSAYAMDLDEIRQGPPTS